MRRNSFVFGRDFISPGEKPTARLIKINWDAALDVPQKRMGVGAVLRNEAGVVVAAMAKLIPIIVDPTKEKSVAAWQAVQFCCHLRHQRVVLEGDSLLVVLALRQDSSCWSGYGQLIEDVMIRLHSLMYYDVRHVRRRPTKLGIGWPM
jgi:hypothetical protein